MDIAIARSGPIAGAVPGRARLIGDFAAMCFFSLAGLILTALGLALVGFEALAQILAVAG
jgi:hypothetical protein